MTIVRHESNEIYSKAAEAGGLVFTAGIVPSDLSRCVKGQTEEVLKEIDRLLALAGTSKDKVVQATIWLADIRHREQMNEAYKAWTAGKNTPVRACVEATLVDPRMLVEISVVAAK